MKNNFCISAIVVSETDGEEDDDSQPTKKEKGVHETHGPHVAAMKKLSGLLSLSIPDSAKGRYVNFSIKLEMRIIF